MAAMRAKQVSTLSLLFALFTACSAKAPVVVDKLPLPTLAIQHQLSLRSDGVMSLDLRDHVMLNAESRVISFWLDRRATILSVEVQGKAQNFVPRILPSQAFPRALGYELRLPEATQSFTLRYQLDLETRQLGGPLDDSWWFSEGFFLSGNTAWYPRLPASHPTFGVEARLPPGFCTQSEGRQLEFVEAGVASTRFESSTPSEGLTFIAAKGSTLEGGSQRVPMRICVHPEHADLAPVYMANMEQSLASIEAILTQYPFPEYGLIEAPVGGLIAFAGFTAIDSHWLEQEYTQTIGLRHELLHSWFGHLVRLGPGGNWIEGLVTYLAEHEYYRQISAQRAKTVRKALLRDHMAALTPSQDLPLLSFRWGRTMESQLVGYAKSAMVFHMLRRTLGDEAFYAALRDLLERYSFEEVGWNEVLVAFERTSEAHLGDLGSTWLAQPGVPQLELGDVVVSPTIATAQGSHSPHTLSFEVRQQEPYFSMTLPVEIELEAGKYHATVDLSAQAKENLSLQVPGEPKGLSLDPDYELFRQLNPDELEASMASVLTANEPQLVVSSKLSASQKREVELANAAHFAGKFTWHDDQATDPHAPALYIVEDQSPTLEGLDYQRLWEGEELADDAERALVLTLAATQNHGPRLFMIVSPKQGLWEPLLGLDSLGAYSYALFSEKSLLFKGLWRCSRESMSWSSD